MSEQGGSAFPTPIPNDVLNKDGFNVTVTAGLTKREWFAGMALVGLLANGSGVAVNGNVEKQSNGPADISDAAYNYADAMLAAGEQKQ